MDFRTKWAAWCHIAMLVAFSATSCVMLKGLKDRENPVTSQLKAQLKAQVMGWFYMVRVELEFLIIKASSVLLPGVIRLRLNDMEVLRLWKDCLWVRRRGRA